MYLVEDIGTWTANPAVVYIKTKMYLARWVVMAAVFYVKTKYEHSGIVFTRLRKIHIVFFIIRKM